MTNGISRKQFLRLAGLSASLIAIDTARAEEDAITEDMVFNDPESPTSGNPKGDLTIVDFFDYNCPYCKNGEKALDAVVKRDGNIRVVYKELPILSPTSIIGARLALAARYQDKYLVVHEALMDLPGYSVPQDFMMDAVRKANVDLLRLSLDEKRHSDDIVRVLKTNLAVAQAVGFQGLPATLVGVYKVNEALNEKGLERVIADARTRQKAKG
ncbi:DsbA family protein [Mesorhizobium sp.]|uniref:DsbA family protein n=1 Tax=Mesorhizobium sp. TaxID=1871066 RepID=UPI0025FDD83E|nr:DsbA family protein [Mesorhizobium sp.]